MPIPILDIPTATSSSTTLQKSKVEQVVPVHSYSSIPLAEIKTVFFPPDKAIQFTIGSFTNFLIEQPRQHVVFEQDFESHDYTRNYDIFVKLPFKKSFKTKAKIKGVSKFSPKPFLG